MKTVRTRFAPSPTGFIHIGNLRTALFAWLTARQASGQFILRFEDTDTKREVSGSREHLIATLKALGLDYDEGPGIGGPHEPYVQSQRLAIYKEWAKKLVAAGRAYGDPYTADEVQEFREQARAAKQPFLYRNHRPARPQAWQKTQPLRFISEPQKYNWHDEVMGDLHSGPEVIDDFILLKSDGYPTYNFAHIIDDAEMEITHLMRGQEFLASVPNYLNLYQALDLSPPIMATLPHVLGPDGHKKLSKRDGSKDVLDYIREGFLPEALINFIATLGWNDGSEQEIYSRQELIRKFRIDHIQKSGARFDYKRLVWLNGAWTRKLTLDDLYTKVQEFWPPEASKATADYKKQVLGLVQERLKFFTELPELSRFFFVDLPINPQLIASHKQLKSFSGAELRQLLQSAKDSLVQSDFSIDDITARLNALLNKLEQKPVVLFSLIRIATTQASASPSLAESLAVLGKERSLRRIDAQLAEFA